MCTHIMSSTLHATHYIEPQDLTCSYLSHDELENVSNDNIVTLSITQSLINIHSPRWGPDEIHQTS